MSTLTLRRSRTDLNPDEDFVLHGKHSSYWYKPTQTVKNSDITRTTANLSQHSYSDTYRDRKYTHSLSDLAHNLESLSKEVEKSLDKSVRVDNLRKSQYRREDMEMDTENDKLLPSYRQYSSDDYETLLYSEPISARNSRFSHVPKKPSKTVASVLPVHREDGSRKGRLLEKYPLSGTESEDLTYFPNTLGSSYELEKMDYLLCKPSSSSWKDRPKTTSCVNRKSKSVTVQEPLDDNFDEKKRLEKLYLMSLEAPTIGSAPPMIMSPYDIELAKLRMERLRIEEERMLELRRLCEVERIRGPKPKWYESKGTDFYYESHKNTEMMKNVKHWEELMTYRNELLNSSTDIGHTQDNIYREL